MRAFSWHCEIASRRLERPGCCRVVVAISRSQFRPLCLFHAFVPCAGERNDGGLLRIRRQIFGGSRKGPHVRSAVSSGKVRGDWAASAAQFLLSLKAMLTKRIIACLD